MPYSIEDFKNRNMKLEGPMSQTGVFDPEQQQDVSRMLTADEANKAYIEADGGLLASVKNMLDAAATKFTFGTTDRTDVAVQIGKNLNISSDVLMDLDEAGWNNVLMLNNQRSKVAEISDLYDNYPELRDIQYKSRSEATQVLQNMADAKRTRGIWDAMQQGVWSMNDQMKLADAAYELANTTDESKVKSLNDEIERLQANLKSYRTLGSNITETIFGDTASQAYMMGKQAIKGTAERGAQGMSLGMAAGAAGGALAGGIGALPGAVAGGMTGLSYGIQTGMAEQMQHMSFGLKYLDLISKKDKNGNRIYSDEEAKERAMAFSVVDTAIEFVALKGAGKAIKGATPASSTLGKLMASHSVAETFQRGALATAGQFVKTGLKTGSLELVEEGLQDINEKVQTNLWGKPGDDTYTLGDIASGSIQAMLDAAPAVLGLGILGGLGGGARTTHAFRQFNRMTPDMKNMVVQSAINERGAEVLQAIIDDSKTNGLAQKNPELYSKVIQSMADKNGMSTVYINANDMIVTEEGQAAVQDLVNRGVITQEEVTKSIENDVPVEVPIASFAQLNEDLDEQSQEVLKQNIHFTEGGLSMNAIQRAAEMAKSIQEHFGNKFVERREAVKEDILKEFDSEDHSDTEREMADLVVGTDPYRIKSNFNELYSRLEEEYREAYNEEYKALEVPSDSTEKPQWYREHVAKTGRAPAKTDKRRLAYEVSRVQAEQDIMPHATEGGQNAVTEHFDTMRTKLEQLEALDAIKDKLFSVADGDVFVRSNLSKEGYELYQELVAAMKQGNMMISKQAKEGALVFASHADVFASIMQEAGWRDYTAKTYAEEYLIGVQANQTQADAAEGFYQFAGMGSHTADYMYLDEARRMKEEGASDQEIWDVTGWKQGKDGMWRYEIPDNLEAVNLEKLKEGPQPLSAIYPNDALYTAYPELADVEVSVADTGIYGGKQIQTKGTGEARIVLDEKRLGDPALKTVLLHEIQHVIQYIDGFAQGSTSEMFTPRQVDFNENELEGIRKQLAEAAESLKARSADDYAVYKQYENLSRELAEKYPKGIYRAIDMDALTEGERAEYEALQQQVYAMPEGSQISFLDMYMDTVKESAPNLGTAETPYEQYMRTAGEQEARETEARVQGQSGMPTIHSGDAIIMFGGETYYQRAYHGSAYSFDRFDLGQLGQGVGNAIHGWGLYFAQDKKMAQRYQKALSAAGQKGNLYTVEVPEDNEMLIEDQVLDTNPGAIVKKVKATIDDLPEPARGLFVDEAKRAFHYSETSASYDALKSQLEKLEKAINYLQTNAGTNLSTIRKRTAMRAIAEFEGIDFDVDKVQQLVDTQRNTLLEKYQAMLNNTQVAVENPEDSHRNSITPAMIEKNPSLLIDEKTVSGKDIYSLLEKSFGSMKDASLYLNEHGIKGMIYTDLIDGRCFVVFDDKAVDIINEYNQALNPGVDIDQQVPVLDLSNKYADAKNMTPKDLTNYVKTLAGSYVASRDGKAVMEVLSKQVNHIVRSGAMIPFKNKSPRNTVINNIIDVLKNAVLIESIKNKKISNPADADTRNKKKKIKRKNSISVYHRFYVPVKIKNKIWTVRIVAEENKDIITVNPATVQLYDVIVEHAKKDRALLPSNKAGFEASDPVITISIREMLSGVKDYDKRAYINKDGSANFNQRINGLTTINQKGQKLIQLFESANFSTFAHEAGHVFLEDLRILAGKVGAQYTEETNQNASDTEVGAEAVDRAAKQNKILQQVVADWEAVKEWTGYVEGADADTNREAHEKFAKGFEAYLRAGKAPSKPLEKVFRKFKEWLTSIYSTVMRLGGMPPKEIQDVMARMIATGEAIDNYVAEQALSDFIESELYETMTDEDKTKYDNLVADIKAQAKETVYTEFLAEYEKQVQDIDVDALETEVERQLIEKYPIYQVSKNYEAYGDAVLTISGYTKDSLKAAEETEGIGPWQQVRSEEQQKAGDAARQQMMDSEYIQSLAEQKFLTHEWQQKVATEEANAIKKYANRYVATNYNLLAELSAIDPGAPDAAERIAGVQKEVERTGKRKRKAKKESDASRDATANRKVIEALKSELQEYIANMRAIKNLSVGRVDDMMDRAHRALEALPLTQATSFNHFQNKSITAARHADIAMAQGKMDEAFRHKQQQLLYQAMARAAHDNVEEVKGIEQDLKKKSIAMARPKNPVRIDSQARYFIQHMLYNMGLTGRDGILPRDGFAIESIQALLDPDAAIMGEPSRVILEQWVTDVFNTGKSWRKLTMSEFKELAEVIRAVYAQGRGAYEGVSIVDEEGKQISFEAAAQEMIEASALNESGRDPLAEKQEKGLGDKTVDKGNEFLLSLLKMETVLRRYDGGKVGVWQRYLYEPIDRATRKGKELLESAAKTLQKNLKKYSKKELYVMRTEKKYTIGHIPKLTKENVIALALNWGTAANRQRVMETVQADEVTIDAALGEWLTDRDWDFIEGVWEQINSFYEARSAVQERLYGTPLHKEKGVIFKINGRKIEGQYYPIVYDSTLDGNAKDYEVEDIIRSQMSSNAVWGMGMSATKERSKIVKNKKLILSFDVIPRAIDEAVNHIAMREAATDVNRLLNNRELTDHITRTLGVDTLQMMKTWVRDNWQAEISKMDKWSRMVNVFKANTSMAIMAYRTSTAVLNILNVIPASFEIGKLNMLLALKSFYGGIFTGKFFANREFVKEHSVFMRERLYNLDKDLNQGLSIDGDGIQYDNEHSKTRTVSAAKRKTDDTKEWINRYAYQFITETDLMISMPVWKFVYEQKVEELLKQNVDTDRIEEEAVTAADRAVRRIFGSGETKDTAGIQRNKGNVVTLFTPFYTYANTVFNALVDAGYAAYDRRDYGVLFNTILHWVVIQGICEALIRSLWDGDDDDWVSILQKSLGTMTSSLFGGLPFIRDIVGAGLDIALGNPNMSRGNETVALSIIPKTLDTFRAMNKETKSWIDVGRSGTQVINRMTGFSDTLTDGLWTMTKWMLTDTDATIMDLMTAIIFDKQIKSKQEKKKEKK